VLAAPAAGWLLLLLLLPPLLPQPATRQALGALRAAGAYTVPQLVPGACQALQLWAGA
jgi:hypothetical protein